MVGQTIGKYRVLDRLGRGGMGTVYRALDETLHREVAIKILNAELNDPEVARRFRAEAVTVARLNHPGIATVYELFQHDGQWLMVMEFVRGETLERMVERLGALPPQRAADLSMQALMALAHAHGLGVVHRDLKPANLMITESGTVKIMDFGIARVAGSEHLTSAGFMMGTPAYMAPEQVLGNEIDARTDLFAIGVVFYYLISKKLPFKGDTPIAMAQSRINNHPTPLGTAREGLPPWIEPVIDRALARDPNDRFQTADQFREALRRGLAGLPMEVLTAGSVPPELIATTPPRALPVIGSGTSAPGASGAISQPVPAATGQTAVSGAVPQPVAPAKKPNWTLIGAAAGIVVLVGVVATAMWMHSRNAVPTTTTASAPPPATIPAPPPPTPAPDPVATATPPSTPPVAAGAPAATGTAPGATTPTKPATPATGTATSSPTTTGGSPTVPTPGSTPGTAPGSTPASGSTGTGTRATPPGTTGATTAGPARPTDAPQIQFSNVKLLIPNGKKVDDQDVVIAFLATQVSVVPKKGGPAIATLAYKSIARATYVRAKDPRWDTAYASPVEAFDVPGLLRGAKHWLVLQSKIGGSYMILRLEDENATPILDAVKARTGLSIVTPG
jgi:eukaryotic-like serine/threonine-protein kinase